MLFRTKSEREPRFGRDYSGKENFRGSTQIDPGSKEKNPRKMNETRGRWEIFDKNFGISFQRCESFEDFQNHLGLIRKNNLCEVQFHLRGENFKEPLSILIKGLIKEIQEAQPGLELSFHLDYPFFLNQEK